MDKEPLSPIQDLVFKKLFGENDNADILADLLMSILSLPASEYESLEFCDTHVIPDSDEGKLIILDIRIKTKSGTILDIEVQVLNVSAMRNRILYYICDLVASQLKRADQYYEIKPVICIVISDYDLVPEETDCHNIYRIKNEKSHKTFSNLLEIHTIELKKLDKEKSNVKLLNWLKFFKATTEGELEVVAQTNPMINKARGILMELSADEILREQIRARKRAWLDYNTLMYEAHEQGLEEGETEREKLREENELAKTEREKLREENELGKTEREKLREENERLRAELARVKS
jgi:predicted transposase/invertase (TIGR01784 family)